MAVAARPPADGGRAAPGRRGCGRDRDAAARPRRRGAAGCRRAPAAGRGERRRRLRQRRRRGLHGARRAGHEHARRAHRRHRRHRVRADPDGHAAPGRGRAADPRRRAVVVATCSSCSARPSRARRSASWGSGRSAPPRARRARAFGMDVALQRPAARRCRRWSGAGRAAVDLDELLATSRRRLAALPADRRDAAPHRRRAGCAR